MISGKILRDAIISGANNINNQRSRVDELNVFPVPDGDTGTNMGMTVGSAVRELQAMDDSCTVGEAAKTAASAMLRGARGNSGVITSLLFRGFSKALEGKKEADAADIVAALKKGVEGAYSHAAAKLYFGEDADLYHVPEFEDTMREVEEGRADYAVLPIENSTAGFVINNYDLLLKYKNYIVGEVYVPVAHMLLGVPGAKLSDIRTVYSHAQALAQSSDFLSAHKDWKQIAVLNTAVAAKKVMEEKDPTQAAVASRTAGELYGMEVLAKEINNVKGNTTRFLILGKEPVYAKTAGKVSVAFEIAHKSGSLYNILGNFIFNNVNMTMIESRPIPEKSFEYRFFVDFEGNLSDAGVRNALTGLAAEASVMRILGNY